MSGLEMYFFFFPTKLSRWLMPQWSVTPLKERQERDGRVCPTRSNRTKWVSWTENSENVIWSEWKSHGFHPVKSISINGSVHTVDYRGALVRCCFVSLQLFVFTISGALAQMYIFLMNDINCRDNKLNWQKLFYNRHVEKKKEVNSSSLRLWTQAPLHLYQHKRNDIFNNQTESALFI